MSQNSQLPLKEAVRNTIEQHSLSDDKLETLLNLQDELTDATIEQLHNKLLTEKLSINSVGKRQNTWSRFVSSAAVISLLAIMATFWINMSPNYAEQIANEAIKNHVKLKPLDIRTRSMDGIRSYFKQLDFSPTYSNVLVNNFSLDDEQLIGGRYCSIKGVTAAQLRYRNLQSNHHNSVNTFYQVPYDAKLHGSIPNTSDGAAPKVLTVKGLEVSLWVEKGLLMVLVSERPEFERNKY